MPLDRSDALNKAARLAGGALEAALAEYLRLFRENPKDWSVGNALGDVYVRLGKSDAAVSHFINLAEHLATEGFVAKARALYRKILRIEPNNGLARQRVDELDKQHVAQASPFLKRVLETASGAPRRAAAPAPPAIVSQPHAAADAAPPIAATPPQPIEPAPPQPVDLAPPQPIAPPPAPPKEVAPQSIDMATAPSTRPPQPSAAPVDQNEWTSVPLAGRELASFRQPQPASADPPPTPVAPPLVYAFADANAAVDAAIARRDFPAAAAVLERFLQAQPDHVGALEKLIEVTVDGQLGAQAIAAQMRLADACVREGRFAQARHVAVDLVLREPDRSEHRALADRVDQVARQHGVALPPAAPAVFDGRPIAAASAFPPMAFPGRPPLTAMPPPLPTVGRVQAAAPTETKANLAHAFEEIRKDLLENAAAAAEDRFAEATRLIDANALDEAARSLEVAMCVPHLRALAGSRLAHIYRNCGAPADALSCLEWVAEIPPPTAESSHELAYELALTLEALGLHTEALGVYRELLAEIGPGYRDIAIRTQQLTAP